VYYKVNDTCKKEWHIERGVHLALIATRGHPASGLILTCKIQIIQVRRVAPKACIERVATMDGAKAYDRKALHKEQLPEGKIAWKRVRLSRLPIDKQIKPPLAIPCDAHTRCAG
jgi:hypothetical protein